MGCFLVPASVVSACSDPCLLLLIITPTFPSRGTPPSLCQSKGVTGTQVWPLRSPHFPTCSDPSGRAGSQSQATERLLSASNSPAEPRDGERKVLGCFF